MQSPSLEATIQYAHSRASEAEALRLENATLLHRVRELTEENESLKVGAYSVGRISEVEKENYTFLGLRKPHHQMMAMMMRLSIVSVDRFMAALFGTRSSPPDDKIIHVYIHQMRKALASYGIHIGNRPGVGYFIPAGDKVLVRSLLEAISA